MSKATLTIFCFPGRLSCTVGKIKFPLSWSHFWNSIKYRSSTEHHAVILLSLWILLVFYFLVDNIFVNIFIFKSGLDAWYYQMLLKHPWGWSYVICWSLRICFHFLNTCRFLAMWNFWVTPVLHPLYMTPLFFWFPMFLERSLRPVFKIRR